MTKANMIRLHANPDAAATLEQFLVAGGALVSKTEPLTQRWYALRDEGRDDTLAIFDIFGSQTGRQAHFDGQVAAALAEKAPVLVQGGWEGVLGNVSNLEALATHVADDDTEVRKASWITLTAAPGQSEALQALLTAGRDIVAETEPQTLFWTALRSEDQVGRFAIFDLFADEAGRAAHFGGAVAKALSEQAGTLVDGGWEDGVLANVVHFDVCTSVRRP